jgi:glycine/D-amino acid oxidase-like deaminating enzyme
MRWDGDGRYQLWDEAQSDAGTRVFVETGGLDFGRSDSADLQALIANTKRSGAPHEVLDHKQLAARFPMFKLPADHIGIFQPNTGLHMPCSSLLCLAVCRALVLSCALFGRYFGCHQ